MITLRPYQETLLKKLHVAWEQYRSLMMVLGTGGGKTVIFARAIHDHTGASAAIVHRREIVAQISVALARLEVKHRVIAPAATIKIIRQKHLKLFGKNYLSDHAQCGVASVQTLTSPSAERNRAVQAWAKSVTLAVFDEGHHYVPDGVWAKAVDVFDRANLLFVTATPKRADGRSLTFPETLILGPTVQWMIDNKYLSSFRYLAPSSDLDVSDLEPTASGDYSSKALRERVAKSHIVGDVVTQYLQFGAGGLAIGFATDVESAYAMAAAFNAAGVPSQALCGKTDDGERARALADFEAGKIRVLWNVDLFDEGFDVPAATVAILARPTLSLAKFLQQCGRVLRPTADGSPAIIIDPVRNWERHGMPNWPRQWSLTGTRGEGRGKSDTIPQRVCASCTQPYEAFHVKCPYCGAVPIPPGRSAPEQVDGNLTELDVAGMQALVARMAAADMSDEDYSKSQWDRHIPAIGRPADMRRHRAAKHRRKVLRELMAWWAGAHPPGREMGEIQKRFYYRFKVDMGTALTLGEKETDQLILAIQEGFANDL
jgi:DNA repair protein RadD